MPFDATPVDSEVVTVLKKARALIDSPEKWCKHPFATCQYPAKRCANLAIFDAVPGMTNLQTRASNALWRATGCEGENFVPYWNDAPERTHAEVMAAFDAAIILAGG